MRAKILDFHAVIDRVVSEHEHTSQLSIYTRAADSEASVWVTVGNQDVPNPTIPCGNGSNPFEVAPHVDLVHALAWDGESHDKPSNV